jgi:hypothetical protein
MRFLYFISSVLCVADIVSQKSKTPPVSSEEEEGEEEIELGARLAMIINDVGASSSSVSSILV